MTADHIRDSARLADAAENLEVWARALVVIEQLAARAIPVIVLKSLPQVEDLYGDVAGRSTGDVDLVIRAEHAREAMDLIVNLGWELAEQRLHDILAATGHRKGLAASRSWHFVRFTNGRPCVIDLHSDRMDPWLRPPLDRAIWNRAVASNRDGVKFMVLGPEDRLLFLCWHFFADSASGAVAWRKLSDIELILRREHEIDRDYLARRAQETGTSTFVHLTCDLVASRARVGILPWWHSGICVPAPRRHAVLWLILSRYAERMGLRQRSLFFLLAHDRLRSVIPLWRELFLPNRARIAVDYLGSWPSWYRYGIVLAKIYAHRLRKTFRGY
jgi:Uncharacterised nucleotidyltransferase